MRGIQETVDPHVTQETIGVPETPGIQEILEIQGTLETQEMREMPEKQEMPEILEIQETGTQRIHEAQLIQKAQEALKIHEKQRETRQTGTRGGIGTPETREMQRIQMTETGTQRMHGAQGKQKIPEALKTHGKQEMGGGIRTHNVSLLPYDHKLQTL